MKKINLVILTLAVLIAACKKTNTNNEFLDKESAVAQVLESKNLGEQKSMYRLLSPDEEAEVWVIKFEKILLNEQMSSEQRAFIKKIKSNMTAYFFQHNGLTNDPSVNVSVITSKAIELFGSANAFSLLSSLSDKFPETNHSLNVVSGPPPAGCGCYTQSTIFDCSGSGAGATCKSGGCSPSPKGCGGLWLYTCDGNCKAEVIMYN